MGRQIKPVDANVVYFPPPATNGQKEWERCLGNQLRPYLPKDHASMRLIKNIMTMEVDRSRPLSWEVHQLAFYILSMLPKDRTSAQRVVSQLFCEDGE